ncbi:MAG: hypothetical protein ACXAC8_02250 [Candidatus Hodarchaeales archaeon]|jgi:hypothetical protein
MSPVIMMTNMSCASVIGVKSVINTTGTIQIKVVFDSTIVKILFFKSEKSIGERQ